MYNLENYIKVSTVHPQVCRDIFREIAKITDLSQFSFNILKEKSDLHLLQDATHLFPNYIGLLCFLLFIKIDLKFYCCIVNKKSIKYTPDGEIIKLEDLNISFLKCSVTGKLYEKTTILEGFLNKTNVGSYFITTDVCYFNNYDINEMNIREKQDLIQPYVLNNITGNKIPIYPAELYNLEAYNIVYSPSFSKYKMRGICYHNPVLLKKLIFMVDLEEERCKNIHHAKEFSNSKVITKKLTIENTNYKLQKIPLLMKQTKEPDVYKMYARQRQKTTDNNGLPSFGTIDVGLADISTLSKSRWCIDKFLESNSKEIRVFCYYVPERNKWDPNEVTSNSPIFVDQIKGLAFEEIQESSDDDK